MQLLDLMPWWGWMLIWLALVVASSWTAYQHWKLIKQHEKEEDEHQQGITG